MAGRLYVEGYWTDDLTHWTRWYPVADEQHHVYVQINPQRPQTLYTDCQFLTVSLRGNASSAPDARFPRPHSAALTMEGRPGAFSRWLACRFLMRRNFVSR